MDKSRKKEILREYRERKPLEGIFVVRCAGTGDAWVGSSRDLDKICNRMWFALRSGGHPNKAMQAAWNAHGEASFACDVVEEVNDDNPLLIPALLKDRADYWRNTLAAGSIS